mmetsp:Transcript_35615/g.65998  ORF Transcript_35615/g.65998 Transcript_35615/m.65998 type:complete len:236 (+) Transcript_35615:148-855(+)
MIISRIEVNLDVCSESVIILILRFGSLDFIIACLISFFFFFVLVVVTYLRVLVSIILVLVNIVRILVLVVFIFLSFVVIITVFLSILCTLPVHFFITPISKIPPCGYVIIVFLPESNHQASLNFLLTLVFHLFQEVFRGFIVFCGGPVYTWLVLRANKVCQCSFVVCQAQLQKQLMFLTLLFKNVFPHLQFFLPFLFSPLSGVVSNLHADFYHPLLDFFFHRFFLSSMFGSLVFL